MDKTTLPMIINDLRSRRDALSLAHEQLKIDSDSWNKAIIVLSLGTGMFESMKIKLGWDNCCSCSYCFVFYHCLCFCFNQI